MLDKLGHELHFQHQALKLLTHRQDILAANIANADTPGYRARDIDFSQQLENAISKNREQINSVALTCTSTKHISAKTLATTDEALLYRIPDQPRADDNTVDMDRERVHFSDNTVKYQVSFTTMNSQLKNIMSAINQG
jgi:flagellar basal-body rod protein FlgB